MISVKTPTDWLDEGANSCPFEKPPQLTPSEWAGDFWRVHHEMLQGLFPDSSAVTDWLSEILSCVTPDSGVAQESLPRVLPQLDAFLGDVIADKNAPIRSKAAILEIREYLASAMVAMGIQCSSAVRVAALTNTTPVRQQE